MKGYSLVNDFVIKHVNVKEFKSDVSDLRIFFVDYDSPIVNTYLVLRTFADNNEGLPHILEHMIFLGSRDYPYRGTLDLLACRALSMGTNAWTAVDHTAYTLSTVGLDGTLNMLPIYLDHILHPTLTQESFITDVHHITTDGTNSGVVYCEMKSNENTADSLMHFNVMENLYPNTPYSMDTGGKISGIRHTNIDNVRQYHQKFYNINNLSIILCGNFKVSSGDNYNMGENILSSGNLFVGIEKVLNVISSIEMGEINMGYKYDKYNLNIVSNTLINNSSSILFPSELEDNGNYSINWRGPKWENFELIKSIYIMGSYLVDSTTSPLEKGLIYNDDSYGSCVDFTLDCYKEIFYQILIRDVPIDGAKMDLIGGKLTNLLLEVYKTPLDLDRLRMLINRYHLNYIRQIETCPSDAIVENIINYAIYSDDSNNLQPLLYNEELNNKLKAKDEDYWKKILYDHFINAPYLSVKCIPSISRSKELEENERLLIQQQLNDNPRDVLERNKSIVDGVKNNMPPIDLLHRFQIFNTKNIILPTWPIIRNFHVSGESGEKSIEVYYNGGSNKVLLTDDILSSLKYISYPVQLNHIPSEFVRIYLLFSTIKMGLSIDEKRLLSLLCILLFESGIYMDGKLLTSEDYIKLLMDNTIAYGANLGISSSSLLPDAYSDFITIYLTCTRDNYNNILSILYNVFYNIKYTTDVVKNHINSLLTSFAKKKRSPKCLVKQLASTLRFKYDSIKVTCGLGQQDIYLKSLNEMNTSILLEKLHLKIFKPENMCVHITTDVNKMPNNFLHFWSQLERSNDIIISSGKLSLDPLLLRHFNFEYGRDRSYRDTTGVISSLASTDVSYFTMIIQAPIGYNNPDFCAINVITEYLSMTEGPLFRAIRGGGYAYNYNVIYYPSQGEIHLTINQATHLIEALESTRQVINNLINCPISTDDIISAKASLIYKVVSNEETLSDYSQETFISSLRSTSVDYNHQFIKQIEKVDLNEIKRIAEYYLKDLLTFNGPPKVISCITGKSLVS